nr:hypothetical protein [Tanacetum cinerariifolium]
MLKSSNYDSNAREAWQDFKDYTQMESQSFKDLVIQHMESIKQCIVKREHHELEIHNWWKRLNERKLHIQECMVQKNKVLDASSREKDCSRIVSDKGNDQVEKVDSNVIPDSRDMCDNELRTNQNAIECDDERVALANLIANLKLNVGLKWIPIRNSVETRYNTNDSASPLGKETYNPKTVLCKLFFFEC